MRAQPSPTVGSSPAQMGLGAQKRSSEGWVAPPGSNSPGLPSILPPLGGLLMAAGRAQGAQPTAHATPEGDHPPQGNPPGAPQGASLLGPTQAWAPGPEGAEASKPRMLELHGPTTQPTAEVAGIPVCQGTARCDGPGPRGRAGMTGIRHRGTADGEGTSGGGGSAPPGAPPPATSASASSRKHEIIK